MRRASSGFAAPAASSSRRSSTACVQSAARNASSPAGGEPKHVQRRSFPRAQPERAMDAEPIAAGKATTASGVTRRLRWTGDRRPLRGHRLPRRSSGRRSAGRRAGPVRRPARAAATSGPRKPDRQARPSAPGASRTAPLASRSTTPSAVDRRPQRRSPVGALRRPAGTARTRRCRVTPYSPMTGARAGRQPRPTAEKAAGPAARQMSTLGFIAVDYTHARE